MSLSITGSFFSLSRTSFDAQHPNGGPLHFREQFRDPAHTQLITYIDPLTGIDTGLSARQIIENQFTLQGDPLIGIYLSASGNVPHFAIHRSDFPSQTGPPNLRADKLQDVLDVAAESIYKTEEEITDPTDPDFGQTVPFRNFFFVTHVWNYKGDNSYEPRNPGVGGDFLSFLSNDIPPGNWWQRFN